MKIEKKSMIKIVIFVCNANHHMLNRLFDYQYLTDDDTLLFEPEDLTPTKVWVPTGPPRIPFMFVYLAQVSHIANVPPSRLRLLGVNGEWQLMQ